MTDPDPTPSRLDEAAALLDTVLATVSSGVRSGGEGADAIGRVVHDFLATSPAEPAEVELILDYARETGRRIAEDPDICDPVLLDYLDEQIARIRMGPELRAHLDLLLDSLDVRLQLGDPDVRQELVQLCEAGFVHQRNLLAVEGAPDRVVQLAYEHQLPEALAAAVRPAPHEHARIGHHHWNRPTFVFALDLLAHLAADPVSDTGAVARGELLGLAGFVETAGEAGVRLPLHLLTDDDRSRLLAIHETRVELFNTDPVHVPVGLHILRDNRVIRSALWQAWDAHHI